jgi:anti-sigma regulatory factor (Ser/Thr protein kinase)
MPALAGGGEGPVVAARPRDPARAARVFPGRAEHARDVRGWARSLTEAACGPAADDVVLAAGELFANAITHSRSGQAGGLVTVIVIAGPDGAEVHVHDQGADGGQVPHMVLDTVPPARESGRGLRIVASVAGEWDAGPAAWCPQAGTGDPAVAAGGCCAWCRIPAQPVLAGPVPAPRAGLDAAGGRRQ